MPASPEYRPVQLREMASNQRPQERMESQGAGALSDTELIAMLLRSGTPGNDVLSLSGRLVADAGSLSDLLAWSADDFKRVPGIGPVKALQLVTVMEIARRVLARGTGTNPIFNRPEIVFAHFLPTTAGLNVEKFWVLCLNRKNRLMRQHEATSGTATSSLVHPREVFREAIRAGASAVICVHNHPSGDPAPSSADIQVTRQLRDAAKAVDIDLLDHIVIGRKEIDPAGLGYYSFRESGLL
ncbi:MAG: DNA repair protein RadC [Opitutaceae bacterium]